MKKSNVIRVGDKFTRNGITYECIGTRPGGWVELFNIDKSVFTDRKHYEVRQWNRINEN